MTPTPTEYETHDGSRCPTCTSPAPHLHPAFQFEGEVSYCRDDFHLKRTAQNAPYVDALIAYRKVDEVSR